VRWAQRNPAPAAAAALTTILAIAGPLAAIVINSQRNTIASRLQEIELLVKENERKLTERDKTVSDLTRERNELLGLSPEVRPADFEMVRMIIDDILKTRRDSLTSSLASDSINSESKARGHLALAYLLAELNDRDAARTEATAAAAELKELGQAQPDSLAWGVGLGEAYRLLQDLSQPSRDVATKQQAAAVKNTLELISKARDTKDSAQLSAIKNQSASWPASPDELYEIACYLTQRPATLAAPQSQTARAPSD
jgi:hypothetical protein